MNRLRSRRHQRGFSIIETFIASVILFIALVGLSIVTTAAAANNRMAAVTVEAERIAASQLNQYAALGVTGIHGLWSAAEDTGSSWRALQPGQDAVDSSGRTIHVVVEASDASATHGGDCMEIRVTVSWQNAIHVTQTQTHSIFVSQNV